MEADLGETAWPPPPLPYNFCLTHAAIATETELFGALR